MSALTTEHFVTQTALGVTISEAQSRTNTFIGALSGALVAMGFATGSDTVFAPFIASVLPILFVMGVLTTVRLVDIAGENMMANVKIAKIRAYYRTLSEPAPIYFAEALGRWPETTVNPSMSLNLFFAYWTSAASMVAVLTALVGSAGVTFGLHIGLSVPLPWSLGIGLFVMLGLLGAFHLIQRARIAGMFAYSRQIAALGNADEGFGSD